MRWIILALLVVATTSVVLSAPIRSRRGELPGASFCPVCEDAISPIVGLLGRNATQSEVVSLLSGVCKIIPLEKVRSKCLADLQSIPVVLKLTGANLMEKYTVHAICGVMGLCDVDCCLTNTIPEQVHLSLTSGDTEQGGNGGEMRVTWITRNMTKGYPAVYYGNEKPPRDGNRFTNASGTVKYIVGNVNSTYTFSTNGWRGFVHTLVMTGLVPGSKYYYQVGDSNDYDEGHMEGTWSQPQFSFIGPQHFNPVSRVRSSRGRVKVISEVPFSPSSEYHGILVGDMGGTDVSDNTVRRMTNLVRERERDISLVIHLGDISYADMNEALDDAFGRKIEQVAAYVPYMTLPGNHESFFNFSAYIHRWGKSMPFPGSNRPSLSSLSLSEREIPLHYSFNFGPIHFLMLNTESVDNTPAKIGPETPQYKFIVEDLAMANANRDKQPFVVVITHRPLYCMDQKSMDCVEIGAMFRSWLEPLFVTGKVNLVLSGHRHDYERSYQLVNGTVASTSYDGYKAPTYIINGAGGNLEHEEPPQVSPPAWLAAQSSNYGYSTFDADMESMNWSFWGSDDGTLIDSVTFTI